MEYMAVESGELVRQNAALALLGSLGSRANNDVFHEISIPPFFTI